MKQHNDFSTLGRVWGRAMNASGFAFTRLKSRPWLKSLMLLCLILPFSALATIPPAAGIKPQMSSPTMRLMENKGQVTDLEGNPRPDVLFLGQNGGMKVAVRPTGISFQFEKQEAAPAMEPGRLAVLKDFENARADPQGDLPLWTSTSSGAMQRRKSPAGLPRATMRTTTIPPMRRMAFWRCRPTVKSR
jgi:hypothetical protein